MRKRNCLYHKGTFTYYVIICDLKNLVPFGHKKLWRPLAANKGSCDLNNVVAYGHNQLWRPPVTIITLIWLFSYVHSKMAF